MDDSYIDRCHHEKFRFVGGFAFTSDYRWRFDAQRCNGIVSDLGAHMIDFARWYVGEIRTVSARLGTFVEHAGPADDPLVPINEAAFVTLQFEHGALGLVQASAIAHQADRIASISMRLHGDEGTLEVDQISGAGHPTAQFRRV